MNRLTEQEIAERMKQYLQDQIRYAIRSEEAADEFLCNNNRLCLSNEDRSGDSHWYQVSSREQVLEIERHFCPEYPRTEQESKEIVHFIILGYNIDFSKPTYITYDLNRSIPILSDPV